MSTHFHNTPVTFKTHNGVEYATHQTRIKKIINPILRFLQFYTNKPYVIASIFDIVGCEYFFIKYKLTKVEYIKG